jgi:hypothetical protein
MVSSRFSLLAAACVLVSGCTSLEKVPQRDSAAAETFLASTKTLPDAVKITEKLRTAYLDRARAQRREERLSGLGLIGLGLLTANMAARGVGDSAVLGLGMVGAGAYAAGNYTNTRADRSIFIYGASALQCALQATQPLQIAYTRQADLATGITWIESDAAALEVVLSEFANSTHEKVVQARNALAKARSLLPAAKDAQTRLTGAGGDLFSVVGKIEIEVEKALETSNPDFRALVASLIQSKILSVPAFLERVPVAGGVKTSAAEFTLEIPTKRLLSNVALVQGIVDLVNVKPTVADLESCKLDLAATGVSMKVEPTALTISAGTTRTALSSGGVPSYSASWLGANPPSDQVVLRSEGNGVLLIEAKDNAQAGTYTIAVSDSARGRESLVVTIVAADTSKSTSNSSSGGNKAAVPCAEDPKVKKVQIAINAKNSKLEADKKPVPLVEDGCIGEKTVTAMKKIQLDQNVAADAIQSDPAKLLVDTASLLGVKLDTP